MKKFMGLLLGALLLLASMPLFAETLSWDGPTTYVDNTAITTADQARLRYYVRINAPNPRDTTINTIGWYYLGETSNNVRAWPSDNNILGLMQSYGFSGKTVQFTVSAALVGTDNVERDSARSPSYTWAVSAPIVTKVPVAPAAPSITK